MLQLSGMIPPVISPLTPERSVDRAAVARLTRHVLDAGADGVFTLGSCGEGATLPPGVARDVVAAYVEAVDGAVPVLAGVAETSTERAVEVARSHAEAGADALVVMAPMYFDTQGDESVVRHLTAVAEATALPLVVYNIPHLTHQPITPAALADVARLDQVVALKESSGKWDVFSGLMAAAKDAGIAVFQGAESLIACSLAEGADGAVPGVANIVPELAVRLVRAGTVGDASAAQELQAELDAVCSLYASGFWLSSLKQAAAALELASPVCGHALPPLDEAGVARVTAVVRERVRGASPAVVVKP